MEDLRLWASERLNDEINKNLAETKAELLPADKELDSSESGKITDNGNSFNNEMRNEL